MTTRAHSPIFEEKEKLLAIYVVRSNQMKTGLNAATVPQVPCRKGTGKGFIMRRAHELLALFFHVFRRAKTSEHEKEYNACMRNGGRDAEATVFACAALGGISLPRLLS